MVTIRDIAERYGVSVATVSKALNNQKDIGAKTKEEIRKLAKEMGYAPNAAAKEFSLSTKDIAALRTTILTMFLTALKTQQSLKAII